MTPFTTLTAVAAPLEIANIDTGMILPGRFMRRHRRPGHDYSQAFLHDLRIDENGAPIPDFPLNQVAYRDAGILVTAADFGCGSSREGAAYAVMDYGFRALIGPSFAEIFYGNCLQIGVLPVVLPDQAIQALWAQLKERPGAEITVDLANQQVIDTNGQSHSFDVNALRKQRLLAGMDDIDATSHYRDVIETFEAKRRQMYPWLPDANGL